MARPKQYDEIAVKDALRDVFWKRGYDGATYAHIMAETGLKKGSLYASFGDKKSLFDIALRRYLETEGLRVFEGLLDNRLTSGIKLYTLFSAVLGTIGTEKAAWGCFICNAATDPGIEAADNKSLVRSSVEQVRNLINDVLPDNQKSRTDHILAVYFGVRALIKAGATFEEANAACESLLAGL